MLSEFKKFSHSKFVRNVAVVATGTAGAQAITMAFSPFITRLYGPEAFGLLGTFMAILAITTPIAALTYPIAIVLPKSNQDALGIAKLSALLAFMISGLMAVIILLFGDSLAILLGIESIAGFLLLIPVAMLFAAFQQILQQWLIRKKQFKVTAKVAVMQALMINSAKVGIGWFNPIGSMLIIFATVGNVLQALLLWFGIRKQSVALFEVEGNQQTSTIKELAKRHKDFPFFRTPEATLSAVTSSLPVLLLALLSGPAAAGFFTLAKSVLKLPVSLLSKSIGDVYYQKAVEQDNSNKPLARPFFKVTLTLFLIGMMPFGVVFVFGPDLFTLFFGTDWLVSGVYSRYLSVWLLFALSTSAALKLVAVLKLQGFFLLYRVFFLFFNSAALYSGFWYFESDRTAVLLMSVVSSLMCLFLIVFVGFHAIKKDRLVASK